MTERSGDSEAAPDGGVVYCRRLDRRRAVAEHAACLYCYGDLRDIETADHREFCDFEPGKDPIALGFPTDYGG